jgi:hypothetical protein
MKGLIALELKSQMMPTRKGEGNSKRRESLMAQIFYDQ